MFEVTAAAEPLPAPVQLILYCPEPNGDQVIFAVVEVTFMKVTIGVALTATTAVVDDTLKQLFAMEMQR